VAIIAKLRHHTPMAIGPRTWHGRIALGVFILAVAPWTTGAAAAPSGDEPAFNPRSSIQIDHERAQGKLYSSRVRCLTSSSRCSPSRWRSSRANAPALYVAGGSWVRASFRVGKGEPAKARLSHRGVFATNRVAASRGTEHGSSVVFRSEFEVPPEINRFRLRACWEGAQSTKCARWSFRVLQTTSAAMR